MRGWVGSGSCAVIAHRGGAALGPANSLGVLQMACVAGADVVEIDLQELGDGSLVLAHDRIIGESVALSDVDIRCYRAITGASPVVLDDLLEQLRPLPLGLYLDVKNVTGDGLRRALDAVSSSGVAGRTVIGSFDQGTVRLAVADGRLPASVLYRERSVDPVALAVSLGCAFVHPCFDSTPWFVGRLAGTWMQRVHDAGLGAISWNSNSRRLLDEMVCAGFDAVCTDDPRLLR